MKWSEFFSKIATVLHKHKMEHLLFSLTTDVSNQEHSSKLCYKLYEKLSGSALAPFNSLDAHSDYLQGGHGVEMIHALCHKFNSLMFEWICALQDKIWKVLLTPQQDLDDFVNEICDANTTLNEAQPSQGYTELQLVNIMLHQLQTSWYADQIKLIMMAYHASSFTFMSLNSVIQALHNQDIFDGKDFGGAPLVAPRSPYHPGSTYHDGSGGGKTSAYGALLAVSDDMAYLQLHPKYPWASQGNLTTDQIKLIHTLWACPLCCTCNHPL